MALQYFRRQQKSTNDIYGVIEELKSKFCIVTKGLVVGVVVDWPVGLVVRDPDC